MKLLFAPAASEDFLAGMHKHWNGPLVMVWDDRQGNGGKATREFPKSRGLDLRLATLPTYIR